MPCSAVTLSIATIAAIVAAALMAIAFSTDNWLYIEVKRSNIQIPTIILLLLLTISMVQDKLSFAYNSQIIFMLFSVSLLLTDVILNIIFLRGAHTKNVKLLKIFYFYNITELIVLSKLMVFLLCMSIYRFTKCGQFDDCPIIALMVTFIIGGAAFNFLLQFYFLRLIKSEIKKLNDRAAVKQSEAGQNPAISSQIIDSLHSKYYFYTRTRGLFRICYPKERPPTVEIYLSPVETHCSNVDYFIPDENNETKGFTDDQMNRLHMARSTIALFIVAFMSLFIAFWTGVVGCWKRSPGNITATAILMLVTCLLSAGAMALWHGVEFYEKEKAVGEEFYQQWPHVLKENSSIWYDWSYILAWISVGVSFTSSIFFFSAAICLSKEKQREQQNNVQYIMPVYPQKQQYAYAGYPPPQAYPGPYYHGSQYGPYNY